MTAEDALPSETGPATWSTWDRSGTADDVRTLRPQTIEQVSEAMEAAAAAGLSTRVTGAGHSFSLLAEPQELRLDTSELVGLQEVDRPGRRATFLGGTPLIQAARELDAALPAGKAGVHVLARRDVDPGHGELVALLDGLRGDEVELIRALGEGRRRVRVAGVRELGVGSGREGGIVEEGRRTYVGRDEEETAAELAGGAVRGAGALLVLRACGGLGLKVKEVTMASSSRGCSSTNSPCHPGRRRGRRRSSCTPYYRRGSRGGP